MHEIAPQGDSSQLVSWKQDILNSMEKWLRSLPDEQPETVSAEKPEPDLFQLFATLQGMQTDLRKSSRKVAGNLDDFSDKLNQTELQIEQIRQQLEEKASVDRKTALQLIGMKDRLERMLDAMQEKPKNFLGLSKRWDEAWDHLREGFRMLNGNYEKILQTLKIEQLKSDPGQNMDPNTMEVIESISGNGQPGTLIETVENGYLLNGEILRLAKVKVAG